MPEADVISVITVCRNDGEFLDQCMRSVLAQDLSGVEYVVIDGGSDDDSVDIIRRHAHRLRYWHSRPDRGLAHAFNQGVEHSTGKWLIFLNADDFFVDHTALSRVSRHLAHNAQADVVFGQVQLVTREAAPKVILHSGRPWRWQEFRRRDTIPHPAAFTSRRFFAQFGGFSEDFRVAVDYEHYLRAGQHLRAHFVPELVSGVRIDGLSRALASVTYRESKLAQQVHNVWGVPAVAGLWQGYYRSRTSVTRTLRQALGWTAPGGSAAGRSSPPPRARPRPEVATSRRPGSRTP